MSTITERGEEAPTAGGERPGCEAVTPFLGIEWPCGEPPAGLFRRACVHEHVRDGWLCGRACGRGR